ncbi:hypothetical protein CEUSTIGMA_g114.t1 [Chlamydomonas eustigma]|uniref:Cyanobacterial aminoacyl-tRNA synthetase CAAD domain-containing protein n=1 Tax=Chlamydomonas eustigma TaxID=1157962 RepID=A0A250WPA2_9CHLO|nr:hypothetical protein CEUSTIGMA_g114.t1 [Chlamydomonas eustigma]|eukprot:GAX72658.1 hypothetical protein CEUSTIGMA_g114.t1 [Chlamydomonas eustigma]
MMLSIKSAVTSVSNMTVRTRSVTTSSFSIATLKRRAGLQQIPVYISRATKEDQDFDALLNTFAEKFEKVENKPVVIGYVVAAVCALIVAEWLIHLPALDVVLGFPVQLLGLVLSPILAFRYIVDKKDATTDIVEIVADLSKKLPGLGNK